MGISAESLATNLAKARYLMSEEGERKVNQYKGKATQVGYNDEYLGEAAYNSMGNYDYQQLVEQQQQQIMQNQVSNSRLPKAILESMVNNPIDTSVLNKNSMDTLMEKVVSNVPTPQVRQQINEDRGIPQANGVIDYNIIRNIIEECIDKKLQSLNENTLKGIKLKGGKIALTDNSGNVYHASLEYKGNLNSKK
jgi:hypothetical protein